MRGSSKDWLWRPSTEGDNLDTWGPLFSNPEPYTSERSKQTEAPPPPSPPQRGSMPLLIKRCVFPITCSHISPQPTEGLFPNKQQLIQSKPFSKYWAIRLAETKVWGGFKQQEIRHTFVLRSAEEEDEEEALFCTFKWLVKCIILIKHRNHATKAPFEHFYVGWMDEDKKCFTCKGKVL